MATRLAVVVVHLASHLEPNPQDAYNDVVAFGTIMDSKRKTVSSRQTMGEFPEDPNGFMALHPTAYAADDPPVESRLKLEQVNERCNKNVTPVRNSNQHVRGPTPRTCAKPAEDTVGGGFGPELQALLLKFMLQQGGAPITKDDLRTEVPAILDRPPSRGSQTPQTRRSNSTTSIGSASDGSSPPPLFDGGVEPECLHPCNDPHAKLRQLQHKLGMAEPNLEDDHPRQPLEAASPPPRLMKPGKKRMREDSEVDEDGDVDEEGEDDTEKGAKARKEHTAVAAGKVLRRPAAALPRLIKAPKGGSKVPSKASYDALFSMPAKVARPAPSQKPTAHAGGKIYFSAPKSCYRVYLRATDRIEKCVRANPASKSDMTRKFIVACAMIEQDKRPIK